MVVSRSSSPAATLAALRSDLGLEDLYDLIEIFSVDAHNDRVLDKLRRDREP